MQTKKNDLGVSPVIAVILMVAITVVLAGVVFLWAQSFTNESGGNVEQLNIRGEITFAAGPPLVNTVTFEIISGSVDWSKYDVKLDGTSLAASAAVDNAGDSESFTSTPLASNVGETLNVKIINIKDNKVVWEDDIRVTNA